MIIKKIICCIATGSLIFCAGTSSMAQATKNKDAEGAGKKVAPLKDIKSKEITTEFSCNGNATLFLENIFRRVNIITTNDNKVKLVTTVYYQGNPVYTDAEWLDKLELGISGNAANVVIRSGNMRAGGAKQAMPDMPLNINRKPDSIANGIAVFDSTGNWTNKKSNIKRNITLYIPAGAKLDIESKYSDITLESNIKTVKVRLTNGGLTMKDAEQLTVNGLYGNVYAGNILNADIDMTNGMLTGKKIETLGLHSKNGRVEVATVNQLTLASNSDNIEIEELGSLKGTKEFGDLRVTVLSNSFDLTGKNADIKIRSIDPSTRLIKIDNQYAVLRLPIGSLKNYTVNFEGIGGDQYASFEKTILSDTSFKASVGDPGAKPTSFQLKCNNCTVDFK